MKKRLIDFLRYLGIGQDKFAKNVGLSRGYVNNIKDNITMKTVDKISKAYPELNKNWLLTGEGEMLSENHSENSQSESYNNKDRIYQILSERLELNFNEIVAIEKSNNEFAELLKKFVDELDISMVDSKDLINLITGHKDLIISHKDLITGLVTGHKDLIVGHKDLIAKTIP